MSLEPPSGRGVLTVSQLSGIIRGVISQSPELEDVLVEGEISNLAMPASGHLYFTLKDAGAAISCVVWRSQRLLIPFRPENGLTVIVHGHLEVYDAQGRYQLYADRLEPSGMGALALAVEQRRHALAAEGLFDDARKRPLPLLPRRVVVVTSRSGAALGDVLTVTARRAPGVDIVLSPATVQGEGAVETLVRAIERAQSVRGAEVVLLVRGGGSLEDLMAFNDERLARSIRGSRIPVVCGVGHETDTTIADLVADRRAATPSAAAELVVPDCRQLGTELAGRRTRLTAASRQTVELKRDGLEQRGRRLATASPLRRIPGHRQELDARVGRLRSGLVAALAVKRQQLAAATGGLQRGSPAQRLALERQQLAIQRRRLADLTTLGLARRRDHLGGRHRHLEALSPLRVLQRGYSITMDQATGSLVTEAGATRAGQRLRTRLARGSVISRVEGSTREQERMYDTRDTGSERG